MSFKIGDMAQLKSGGPIMTVSYDYGDGTVEATWFVNNEPKSHTFKHEVLKPYREPDYA